MEKQMTVVETYDKLLNAWEMGIKTFSKESMAAIQSLKSGKSVENIEFIDSILKFNYQTASYLKQLVENIVWTSEESSTEVKKRVDQMFVTLGENTEILNTMKEINNQLNMKMQVNENSKSDTKVFAIRLADDKSYVEFHCDDLKEHGIIPKMPLVVGKDRMSLKSNVPVIINHVKEMMIKEEYNTVLYEYNNLAIYCELAAEVKNIPELIFVETDREHRQ